VKKKGEDLRKGTYANLAAAHRLLLEVAAPDPRRMLASAVSAPRYREAIALTRAVIAEVMKTRSSPRVEGARRIGG
jgi:hypothetical protein